MQIVRRPSTDGASLEGDLSRHGITTVGIGARRERTQRTMSNQYRTSERTKALRPGWLRRLSVERKSRCSR